MMTLMKAATLDFSLSWRPNRHRRQSVAIIPTLAPAIGAALTICDETNPLKWSIERP